MMKMIKSASSNYEESMNHSRKILKKMKELLNAMDDAPSGFIKANPGLGLEIIYDELIDDIPALDLAIKTGDIAYSDSSANVPKKQYEDMW